MKTLTSMYEAQKKSDYTIYHDTYTGAIDAALDFATRNGYEYDEDETAQEIGMGPKKPSGGNTNKFTEALGKESYRSLDGG